MTSIQKSSFRNNSSRNSSEKLSDSRTWSSASVGETDALLSPIPNAGRQHQPSKLQTNYSTVNKPPSDSSSSDMTDLVIPRRWWCCGSGDRWCRWYWHDRLPKGKASALVFFLNVVESFAFYGATSGALKLILRDEATSNLGFMLSITLEYCVARLIYPIMGVIADTYVGRHRMIHVSLWLFWVAYGILAIALSLDDEGKSLIVRFLLPITAFVLVSLGAAGFEVNIIPFGMDQLQGASSAEMSSYFYWYYFGRQLGILFGLLLFFVLEVFIPDYQAIQPLVVTAMLTVAALSYYFLQDWLFKDRERENPLWLVIKVVWFAATVRRQLPRYRRAFRYGETRKPRIELAKIDYDGIYSREVVEDVKTFCRIILLLISLGGYFMSYSAGFVMFSYQASSLLNNMSRGASTNVRTYVYPNIHVVYDVLVIVLTVLLVNYLVIPYLPLSFNMKRRLGFGMLLNLAALLVAILLEEVTVHSSAQHRLMWLTVPAALIAWGEMVVFVTGLEFIYAQSPECMKGLLTGLFYCIFGLSSGAGTTIYFFFTKKHCKSEYVYASIQDVKGINFIMIYYVIFAVIAAVGVVLYSVVACLYTHRQRTHANPLEDDDWDRSYVHNVYSTRSPQ